MTMNAQYNLGILLCSKSNNSCFCFDEAGTHLFGKIITKGSLSRQIRNSAMTDLSNPSSDLAFNTRVFEILVRVRKFQL